MGFLVAMGLSSLSTTAFAQAEGMDGTFDSSQNWAENWVGNWRQRVLDRNEKIERLLRWQVSDVTLITFYGQLNLLYLDYGDGIAPFTSVRNNPNAPARIGLTVETALDSGVGLNFNVESGLPRSSYDDLFKPGAAESDDSDWNRTLLRKAELRISMPEGGFISIGQGSMAGDGITGFDFSNTTAIATNSVADTASGTATYFANGLPTNSSLQSFFPTFDAARRMRLRFDSRSRKGLSWSASLGREVLVENNSNTYADVALRYETRVGRFRVKGGIAYAFNDTSPDFLSGSVAGIDKTSGLNFAFAAGRNSQQARYAYLKLGVTRELLPAGAMALAVDYYSAQMPQALANSSESWGISLTQDIKVANAQVFATYRKYDIVGSGLPIQGAEVVGAGIRVYW